MRVFISSTVYDLIDIRAELAEQLRALGIVPVLSDDKLSDFQVQHDVNSIETCLVNVASCDEVIIILDRRYGPSLGKFGYDNVSATHLEYRHAIEQQIPVHFYIRDRLEADFSIWKRNNQSDEVRLSWVSSKDTGLFKLLEEHTKLRRDSASNWYSTFSNSIDLKAATARYLEARILPQRLVGAIQNNAFPLFDINLNVEQKKAGVADTLEFTVNLTNVGGVPAFNFRIRWEDRNQEPKDQTIVAPGQSVSMMLLYAIGGSYQGTEAFLIAEYESPIGIAVCERYRIHGHIQKSVLISGGNLLDRQYKRIRELSLEVDDA